MLVVVSVFKGTTINKKIRLDHEFLSSPETLILKYHGYMHNQIRDSGYSKTFIARNVQCNGENITSFIHHNGNNSEKMLKVLGGNSVDVSITDLAMNTNENNE
jgi:uncharacterized protein DUF3718